jgi:hypothetical protein
LNGRLSNAILAGQQGTCCRSWQPRSIHYRWIRA